MDAIYNGSVITKEIKEKRQLYFIEELFTGDFRCKAPKALRNKLDKEILENIEVTMKCFYRADLKLKIAFKNYKHFQKTIKEVGINLKQYTK